MIQFAFYRVVLTMLGLALAYYAFTTTPTHPEQAWLQPVIMGLGLILAGVGVVATFTRSLGGK